MNKLSKIFFLLIFMTAEYLLGQADPMLYQRWNIMDINRVRTQFNNSGQLCDGNQQNIPLAHPPSFEYPNGSGLSWGTAVGLVIGAPVSLQDTGATGGVNPEEKDYCDITLDEGNTNFWHEEHFAPYPEITGGLKANLSTDKDNWPKTGSNQGWPSFIPGTTQPLLVGAEGWPGMGLNGERIADQETYSVMYGWKGTDDGEFGARYLKTNVEMRGLAWVGELYQDFIVWMYVIRNIGTTPIRNMRAGVHSDYGFIPGFLSPVGYGDNDRHYYDPKLQMAYGTDDDAYELNPAGGTLDITNIAWAGTIVFQMPGQSKKAEVYDAFHFWAEQTTPKGNGADIHLYYRYNLCNQDDPQDSNHDGIDDDFDFNGVPDDQDGGMGYYLASGADGVQLMGSGAFTLNPGEADTVIFATVFGLSKNQLYKAANNALSLYKSNWKVVKAPAEPKVEIIPQNGRNTIYWSIDAEKEQKFEGYKIYRSVDNGITWGSQTFNDFAGGVHYVPLAQFDKVDSISSNYRTLPDFAWFNLGTETDLPLLKIISGNETNFFKTGDSVRVFVDDQVVNGQKYRYYVAAYDTGNAITGPLENTAASTPKIGSNTVESVPAAPGSKESLSDVKVVPNPYIISSGWETGKEKILQFTHMPPIATIKIYNSAGELVRTIEHNSGNSVTSSIAIWDLKNESQQLVSAGLYLYHLESDIGSKQGKFIVIQ